MEVPPGIIQSSWMNQPTGSQGRPSWPKKSWPEGHLGPLIQDMGSNSGNCVQLPLLEIWKITRQRCFLTTVHRHETTKQRRLEGQTSRCCYVQHNWAPQLYPDPRFNTQLPGGWPQPAIKMARYTLLSWKHFGIENGPYTAIIYPWKFGIEHSIHQQRKLIILWMRYYWLNLVYWWNKFIKKKSALGNFI